MADQDDDKVNVYINDKQGNRASYPAEPGMWDRVKEESSLNSRQLSELDKQRAQYDAYKKTGK